MVGCKVIPYRWFGYVSICFLTKCDLVSSLNCGCLCFAVRSNVSRAYRWIGGMSARFPIEFHSVLPLDRVRFGFTVGPSLFRFYSRIDIDSVLTLDQRSFQLISDRV